MLVALMTDFYVCLVAAAAQYHCQELVISSASSSSSACQILLLHDLNEDGFFGRNIVGERKGWNEGGQVK